jgi:peroxiredoxin
LRESVAKKKIPVFAIDPHESWAAKALLRQAGKTTDDLSLPLLLDPSLTVSASYGVLFQMNIHIEESNRPATFIVDREGILRYAHRAKSFGDRPSPDDVLAEVGKLR